MANLLGTRCIKASKATTPLRRRPIALLAPAISVLALPVALQVPLPALVPPRVLAPLRVLALALVLPLVLAEPMPSRPQPLRRTPPPGRAWHGLRIPASRTDTVCPR
jgi:hypothetical protein